MNARQKNLEDDREMDFDRASDLGRGSPPRGVYFGIPLGDLGLPTSILMSFTLGFLSFFLVTFLTIAGIMIYNGMGHHVDYASGYKYVAFPAACAVLAISLIFFGSLWLRRKASGG
jgi:hypothetical protein